MGAERNSLQMSESDSGIKSAKIAGHIAQTKNHTPLTITTIRLTFLQNYPFSILQKVTRSHIRYLNRIPPPNRESLPRVGRHTPLPPPQKQ